MEKSNKINYIHEINSFYRWIELYPLPGTAISLWHAFMNINNKVRWNKNFTASIQTLTEKTGFQRKALFKARAVLTEAGRIRWISKGSNAACYEIIPFNDSDFEMTDTEYTCDESSVPVDNNENSVINNDQPQLDLFNEQSVSSEKIRIKSELPNKSSLQGPLEGGYEGPVEGPLEAPHGGLINNKTTNCRNDTVNSFSFSRSKKITANQIFNFYNQICKDLIPAKTLNKSRKTTIQRRLKEYGAEKVIQMLQNAAISKYLAGKNNIGWVANIDWIFGATHFIKILEGDYNGLSGSFKTSTQTDKPSPFEILSACYNQITGNEEHR